jgi:hypothetical protein
MSSEDGGGGADGPLGRDVGPWISSFFTITTHTEFFAVDLTPRLDAPLRNTRRGVVVSWH